MPRRNAAIKRDVLPDPLYNSEKIAKFINVVMRKGKKSIAESIIYNSLQTFVQRLSKEKDKEDGEGGGKGKKASGSTPSSHHPAVKSNKNYTQDEIIDLLDRALTNVAPTVEVKSRRVGGATYQVPVEVAIDRGIALAMRWVAQAAAKRSEKTMSLRLSAELFEAYMGRGTAVKMRDDVHRMAKANQAFAHYRW
jgi:small subunit ribosomal protein S7